MRNMVLICPDCGDSLIMSLGDDRTGMVTFNSKCGTRLTVAFDSTASTERERIRKLKEGMKNV